MQLGNHDAYVNIAGGIKITEPAIDLGIALAIISSFKNRVIGAKVVAVGEVGLSGEVRAVSMIENRVSEAMKLGFEVCVVPSVCKDELKSIKGIRLIYVSNVSDIAALEF